MKQVWILGVCVINEPAASKIVLSRVDVRVANATVQKLKLDIFGLWSVSFATVDEDRHVL